MDDDKKRSCPNCGHEIVYTSPNSFYRAQKEKRVCHDCRYKLYSCGKHERTAKEKLRFSRLCIGRPPWNKGIPMTEVSRRKLSASMKKVRERVPHWNLGRKTPAEVIKKLSDSHRGQQSWMAGKKHSEETKEKIRKSLIESFARRGYSSKYNPVACKYIDELNRSRGWNLRHAGNGGEVEVCGYFFDGYDEKAGIIFEYDEPRHHLTAKKIKDITRQVRILEHFKKLEKHVNFYRYDERDNKFYEVGL